MANFSLQFFFFLTFFIISTLIVPILSHEVEHEEEFSYDEKSKVGPSNWGTIHKEWELCGKGKMQSPIDLLNKRVSTVTDQIKGGLIRNYKPSNATLKNRGHDIMLQWEGGAGEMTIKGTKYVLKQIHWHSPSEHTLNGKRYDLEAHMVHESRDKKIAVVGILYTIGNPDPFLASMQEHFELVTGAINAQEVVGVADPRILKVEGGNYYRYIGSLTVPPCSENVLWTVSKTVKTVGLGQVNLLRTAVHDKFNTNARPTQN